MKRQEKRFLKRLNSLKKLISLLVLIMLLCAGCTSTDKPAILFNRHPISEQNVYDYSVIFPVGARIYYLVLVPKKIQSRYIYIQVIKKDNSITLIQRGRIQKLVDKQSILATLSAQFISFKLGCKLSEVDNVKCQTIRRGKDFIKKLLFQFFEERLLKQYNVFLNEKGVQTHIEDLGALSHYNYIE